MASRKVSPSPCGGCKQSLASALDRIGELEAIVDALREKLGSYDEEDVQEVSAPEDVPEDPFSPRSSNVERVADSRPVQSSDGTAVRARVGMLHHDVQDRARGQRSPGGQVFRPVDRKKNRR